MKNASEPIGDEAQILQKPKDPVRLSKSIIFNLGLIIVAGLWKCIHWIVVSSKIQHLKLLILFFSNFLVVLLDYQDLQEFLVLYRGKHSRGKLK